MQFKLSIKIVFQENPANNNEMKQFAVWQFAIWSGIYQNIIIKQSTNKYRHKQLHM